MPLDITDKRIIQILTSSFKLIDQQQVEQLVIRLPKIEPADLFTFRQKLSPAQDTNYCSLYYNALERWKSRFSREATPERLCSILETEMNLPDVAAHIRAKTPAKFDFRMWILDVSKYLSEQPELQTIRWEALMRELGLETEIGSVRQVGTVNLKEYWYSVLVKYRSANGTKGNLIDGLKSALLKLEFNTESESIQSIVDSENGEPPVRVGSTDCLDGEVPDRDMSSNYKF